MSQTAVARVSPYRQLSKPPQLLPLLVLQKPSLLFRHAVLLEPIVPATTSPGLFRSCTRARTVRRWSMCSSQLDESSSKVLLSLFKLSAESILPTAAHINELVAQGRTIPSTSVVVSKVFSIACPAVLSWGIRRLGLVRVRSFFMDE